MTTPKLNPITSLLVEVTPELIKDNAEATKAMIKKHLGKGAKNSHVYDIQAASVGLNNYQTVKGLADKDHYTLVVNMGSRDNPFEVVKPVGFFSKEDPSSYWEARQAAEKILDDCEQMIEWSLMRNDEFMTEIRSKPSEKGLHAQIKLWGKTERDLELALEETERRFSGNYMGFDSNESGSFHFQVVGEEDVIELCPPAGDYIIFDKEQILKSEPSYPGDFHSNAFNVTVGMLEDEDFYLGEWSEFLVRARAIDLEDAYLANGVVYALDSNGKYILQAEVGSGVFDIDDLEKFLQEQPERSVMLYEAIESATPADLQGGRSISDDDVCSECEYCIYCPGGTSYCRKNDCGQWPAKFNEDGQAIECKFVS